MSVRGPVNTQVCKRQCAALGVYAACVYVVRESSDVVRSSLTLSTPPLSSPYIPLFRAIMSSVETEKGDVVEIKAWMGKTRCSLQGNLEEWQIGGLLDTGNDAVEKFLIGHGITPPSCAHGEGVWIRTRTRTRSVSCATWARPCTTTCRS